MTCFGDFGKRERGEFFFFLLSKKLARIIKKNFFFSSHHRPQRQRHVQQARVADVPDPPAVGSAFRGLEPVDDLHRPDFGSARDGSGRQRRPQGVPGGQFGEELARDGRGDVHDVRVALDFLFLG